MDRLKMIMKAVIPPFVWNMARKNSLARSFRPQWNSLSFDPVRGVRLFFDQTGTWQQKMLSGTYDSFLFKRLGELDPKGRVIYDIGSHIGFHALYFSRLVGPTGVVIALEPNAANFERLNMNIEGNPELATRIKTFNLAAADTSGTTTFMTNDDLESGRSTGGFIERADTHWGMDIFKRKGFTEREVRTIPTDEIASKLDVPEPDFIKIDVEGAEYQVLRGMRRLLTNKKPILFIEVHSIAAMFDVTAFLRSMSYEMELINKEANGVCYIEARVTKK